MSDEKITKNWTEIILMPLVIAIVGIIGAYFAAKIQNDHARKMNDAQIQSSQNIAEAQTKSAMEKALMDRRVKILELFFDKMAAGSKQEKERALLLLKAVDPELASILSEAIAKDTNDFEIRSAAEKVTLDSKIANYLKLKGAQISARNKEFTNGSCIIKVTERLEPHGFIIDKGKTIIYPYTCERPNHIYKCGGGPWDGPRDRSYTSKVTANLKIENDKLSFENIVDHGKNPETACGSIIIQHLNNLKGMGL